MKPRVSIRTLKDLLARTSKDEKTGCMEYLGHITPLGYGRFYYKRKQIIAHRFVLIKTTGKNPINMDACHSCDNRKCINPDHLWWGTRTDNVRDMFKKGRAYWQTNNDDFRNKVKNANSKLNYEQCEKIRLLYKQGVLSQREIALKYSVAGSVISRVCGGKYNYANT